MKKIIIATIKSWNIKEAKIFRDTFKYKYEVVIISNKRQLNYDAISTFRPDFVFFPHWSWIIPEEIFKNFQCIVFHMTDLPYGRGGSPLQNLIDRGFENTKITAIKVVKELDSGPIYMKKDLNLNGSAEEVFIRASKIIFREMIPIIIEKNILPTLQKGEVTIFKRRNRKDGNIKNLDSIKKIFDYIRMLDAEGYPKAFCEVGNFILEFSRASLKTDYVLADVKIYDKRDKKNG